MCSAIPRRSRARLSARTGSANRPSRTGTDSTFRNTIHGRDETKSLDRDLRLRGRPMQAPLSASARPAGTRGSRAPLRSGPTAVVACARLDRAHPDVAVLVLLQDVERLVKRAARQGFRTLDVRPEELRTRPGGGRPEHLLRPVRAALELVESALLARRELHDEASRAFLFLAVLRGAPLSGDVARLSRLDESAEHLFEGVLVVASRLPATPVGVDLPIDVDGAVVGVRLRIEPAAAQDPRTRHGPVRRATGAGDLLHTKVVVSESDVHWTLLPCLLARSYHAF